MTQIRGADRNPDPFWLCPAIGASDEKMMKWFWIALRALTVAAAIACLPGAARIANAQGDLQSLSKDPKQWPMAPHDYAKHPWSPEK